MKIIGCIVSYNPDFDRLKKNIESVIHQIDKLVLFDNNSNNSVDFKTEIEDVFGIEVIKNNQNIGISGALNYVAKKYKDSYDWMLTLDQDSICPEKLIENYKKYIDFENIGMFAVRAEDFRRGSPKDLEKDYEYVNRVITSGSLVNLKILDQLDYFDDVLFIDYVDYEYCQRLLSNGYQILRINNLILNQEFGASIPSDLFIKVGRFFHLKNKYFNEIHYITQYSTVRVYYSLRNAIYVARKYKELSVLHETAVILFWFFERLLLEEHKLKILVAGLKGLFTGFVLKIKR